MSYDDFIIKYFIPKIIKASSGNIFAYTEMHEGAERLVLKRYFAGKRRTVIFSHEVLQMNYRKFLDKNKGVAPTP